MKPRRREELWSPECVRGGVGHPRTRQARRIRTPHVALLSVVGLGALSTMAIGARAWAHSGAAKGHAARVLNVRDEGRLHYVRGSGEQIIDEGHATGSFP